MKSPRLPFIRAASVPLDSRTYRGNINLRSKQVVPLPSTTNSTSFHIAMPASPASDELHGGLRTQHSLVGMRSVTMMFDQALGANSDRQSGSVSGVNPIRRGFRIDLRCSAEFSCSRESCRKRAAMAKSVLRRTLAHVLVVYDQQSVGGAKSSCDRRSVRRIVPIFLEYSA